MSLETHHTGSSKEGRARWLIGALLVMLVAGDAMADGMGHMVGHHGWVMARSMVLDDDGQPILVEYNNQGEEVRELSLPGGYQDRVDELEIFSGQAYRAARQRLDAFRNDDDTQGLAQDALLLPMDQVAGERFEMADNSLGWIRVSSSDLERNTKSVLIRGQSNRLTDDVDQLILQEYSFDLTQSVSVDESVRSIVVNPKGQVVATSQHTVAPRVGFFGSEKEAKSGSKRFDPQSDEIFGPVGGVPVFANGMANPQARDTTGNDGRYSFGMFMPCIPGGITFVTSVQAKLEFSSFNPLGEEVLPYYLQQRSFTHCSWTPVAPTNLTAASLESQGAFESAPETMHRVNLYVDVMVLTGEMGLQNPTSSPNEVPLADKTRYSSFDEDDDPTASTWYDFNNDGAADTAVIGKMKDVSGDGTDDKVFVKDESGSLQGVFLSTPDSEFLYDEPNTDGEPDLIRVLDDNHRRRVEEDTGLLESISREDLQNTDLLVFRAATGELIMERRGLSDDELGSNEIGVSDEGDVGYRLFMRGPQGSGISAPNAASPGSFKEWATDYQLTEPFQSKDSFHLQPGEWVEVVAINRTTGYMGTQRVQLTSVGDPGNSGSPDLSVNVDAIKLRPPNLKVWAERDYTVDKGAEAGEQREGQIIGSEGAGLQSDDRIIVHTEWLDHDGSALPEGLSASNGADFGLTGRLAKVVGPDLLQADGVNSDLAEFPIRSGKQKQILKFGGEQAPPEHYYLHVIGKARNQQCQGASCPDFDTTGAQAGLAAPFNTRPRYVTPFLTPHYDEEGHWLAYREYRRILREGRNQVGIGVDPDLVNPERPRPTYAWKYRPEYQFSRFDLTVDELNRVDVDDDTGERNTENLLEEETPMISSDDQMLEILYSLVEPEFDRLAPIDGDQSLILAIGEDETRVTMGDSQRLELDNLDHLDHLDPEDFLSLKLYQNEDAANILWEFAFARVSIHLDANHDGIMNESSVDPNNLDTGSLTEQDKAALEKSDYVSPERPFRFWLNNDYDVVIENDDSWDVRLSWAGINSGDNIKLDRKTCPKLSATANARDEHCVENQKVIMDGDTMVTNSDAEHRNQIESFRDLEDFSPMVMRLDEATYENLVDGDYKMMLKASNIGINLFHGTWDDEMNGDRPDRCDDFPESEPAGSASNIRKHLQNCQAAYAQTENGLHVAYVSGAGAEDESEHFLPYFRVRDLFEEDERKNGFKGNFLFEGVDPCTTEDASECYFQVKLIDNEKGSVVASTKTYIDLQPIKAFYDHFTAGTWIECRDSNRDFKNRCTGDPTQRYMDLYTEAKDIHAGEVVDSDEPGQLHQNVEALQKARYRQPWRDNYEFRSLFTPLGEEKQNESEDDPYVMFVHGWRMPYAERVAFAETTLKRLYWQGYRGRFGTFSWPTSYVFKNSNLATDITLLQIFADINNYSRSERIARDAGPVLKDKLAELKSNHNVHLLAHSMGNVVASEALRAAETTLLETYVATQAATSAGAYAPTAASKMDVDSVGRRQDIERADSWWGPIADWFGGLSDQDCLGAADFEVVWRCNNVDSEGWYDIPPDWYRKQPPVPPKPRRHPNRTQNKAYYEGIRSKVEGDRIINFFNQADAALDGWNAQQVTKPDMGQRATGGEGAPNEIDTLEWMSGWVWKWDHEAVVENEQACSADPMDCEVADRFKSPQSEVSTYDLNWENRYQQNAILSMILPSRTFALGATAKLSESQTGEIADEVNLRDQLGYTNSDFDHSAQWYDSYTEQRRYWRFLNGAFVED